MLRKSSFIFLCIFSCFISYAQPAYKENECKKVLILNQLKKKIIFQHQDKEYGILEDTVTYLGKLTSRKGKTFKIVTWSTIWGVNRHTINFVYVYDNSNRYIGKYKFLLIDELPQKIEKNKLVFFAIDEGHINKLSLKYICFTDGPPNILCVGCLSPQDGIGHQFSREK